MVCILSENKELTRSDVNKYLVGSVVFFFVSLVLLVIYFIFPFAPLSLLYWSFFGLIFSVVSIVTYFINPEIMYGVWKSRKKTKDIDNSNIALGRRIQIIVFVFLVIVMIFFIITEFSVLF